MDIIRTDNEIIQRLDGVDWDFPGSTTLKNTIHSLHRFPGNFIPQVPSYLIQILSQPGDLILDPFCGSGTTGIEALKLARKAYQSDINHASIEVAKGKLAMFTNPKIKFHIRELIEQISLYPLSQPTKENGILETDPELNKWFHELTLEQFKTIWQIIITTPEIENQELFKLLFTDTLFACASTNGSITSGGKSRRHHWGWIADNVKPKPPQWHNALKVFRERLIHAYDVALSSEPIISQLPSINVEDFRITREDSRSLRLSDSSIDLVVTSPPYLGMIDYTLANRLTYLWFGWSMGQDKELEIGARYRRSRQNTVDEYLKSMDMSCKQIARVLRKGAFCAIVIGSSRKFPEVKSQVIEIFGRYLEPFWGPVQRNPSRRRISERQGSEFFESVCVFRK